MFYFRSLPKKKPGIKSTKRLFQSENEDPVPEFDCFAGVELSESADSDEEYLDQIIVSNKIVEMPRQSNTESSELHLNMIKIMENLKESEQIQDQFRNVYSKQTSIFNRELDHLNVRQILALGENKSGLKSEDDNSDWEEVEGNVIKLE